MKNNAIFNSSSTQVQQDPEQYIKNSDPNLYKPYNTFSLEMYKVIVKFWL